MQPDNDAPGFCIWGVDNIVYGPVDLPTLVNWVQEERVAADTWIHLQDKDTWQRASQVSELQMFFQPKSASGVSARKVAAPDGTTIIVKPGSLRRLKILAGMSDHQLDRFVEFMELQRV